ncbi:MAG: 8-amino-7-oxononanoate synthase [Euryarchaeota archaeon]|nr:8-amino-7-oxononanoate synthase [Euryarchaeota archaeon]
MIDKNLQKSLDERIEACSYRQLSTSKELVDFFSNDYLGFARKGFKSDLITGSTGSRLISGNHEIHDRVEKEIANFHNAESALIFNSGYDANLSFFSTIPDKGDTVIYDQLCHASIRDGLRLGTARSFSFKHNDLEDLALKLSRATGQTFIAVESIYSMEGDTAPLKDLEEICQTHNAHLIVDEAHATGVFGEGLCHMQNVTPYARIHTFGKALGCHGAAIVGSKTLRDYLVNFARPFIYTTALPPHSIDVISKAYKALKSGSEQQILHDNISFFKSQFESKYLIESNSPIQCVIIGGNEKCRSTAAKLQTEGFDIRPILSPTVPEGSERLRICLHSFNSQEEIAQLCDHLKHLL